jgi:hypothetical protein
MTRRLNGNPIAHVDLAVAALSPWTHNHVGSLRAVGALPKLKFDHIAFTQGSTSLSYYRRVMDKDIRAVTALDKTVLHKNL